MKKTITLRRVALAAAIAVAACPAYACSDGEKAERHDYETTRVFATCESAGYTLHTCKDCGHKYADGFVEPYGHAYEYCVFVTSKTEQQSARSAALKSDASVPGITIADMAGSPIHSAAQKQLSDMLKEFADKTDGYDVTVKQDCAFCNRDGWYVPVLPLAIVPPPVVDINFDTVQFEMTTDVPKSAADQDEHAHSPFLPFGFETSHETSLVMDKSTGSKTYGVTNNYVKDGDALKPETTTLEYSGADAAAKEYNQITLPDDVTVIAEDAFKDFSGLTRAQLPESLTTVGDDAFGSAKFEWLILPAGLTTIGENAFGDCEDLDCIFYCGTEEQWKNIAIAENNDGLKSKPLYFYSHEKPTAKGNYWHFVNEQPTVWKI